MWIYDEQWIVETEDLIRATYAEAGAPYDTTRASVWNARCVSQAASGVLSRQKARWSTLNALAPPGTHVVQRRGRHASSGGAPPPQRQSSPRDRHAALDVPRVSNV